MKQNQKTILAIDDSSTNIILIEGILSDTGYKVDSASNATEAMEKVSNNPPNLILLDLMMPKISGFKFLRWLREEAGITDIPVIIVSAKRDQQSVSIAHEMGASDYIKKPINIEDFILRVEKALSKS